MINAEERKKNIYKDYKGSSYYLDEYLEDTWKDGWKCGVKSGIDVAKDALLMFIVYPLGFVCVIMIIGLVLNNFIPIFKYYSILFKIALPIYVLVSPKILINKAIKHRGWRLN